ncbi:DUF2726 domain-containing protein [Vreelandella gomseomensis]|uniref:DUF2726 domain-containing protein n=1 Tax=Vreelandella gomseomensis TaxID=370766 RepID=A0ABU1GDY5_9GAMM|nr:DUF2726 domain-containing protein [Halomonas gomseomensis]MDR5875517.1 DUF2726 domain-containing protein [Halomonas gomseomensis]
MEDVNILGALTPLILTFVLGAVALEAVKVFFFKSTVKGFIKAFVEGLNGDEKNKKRYYHSNRKQPEIKKDEVSKEDGSFTEKLIEKGGAYKRNEFLMTQTERHVYKILEKGYGDEYYIFAQVRVVDVIQPNMNKYYTWTGEYKALFRQLSQWHFDYVMCDKSDFSIFCALELDDASHERADRVRRDRILNAVCKDAGLDLKRIKLNHENKRVEVVS